MSSDIWFFLSYRCDNWVLVLWFRPRRDGPGGFFLPRPTKLFQFSLNKFCKFKECLYICNVNKTNKEMNTKKHTPTTPAEFRQSMFEKFSAYRKEFEDYLNAPMLVACNSVVVVNNDNTLTIGVDTEKHVTKLNRGFAFPCTFTPKKAREIAAADIVKDGNGNILPLQVKNIAVFCREQIEACDDMLALLR